MSEFPLGSYVRKPSGAFWEGVVVGHYGTKQTEDGVAVQLFGWEDGPVQIYPAAALQLCDPAQSRIPPPMPMVNLTDDELSWIQAAIQLEKPGMVVFPTTPPPSPHSRVLQKLPAAFEVLDTESGTYLTRSEDRARNSGFEYNGLYRRDSAEPEVTPHPDDLAVDRFAAAMKAKLAKKRDEGKSGWEDKDECSQLFLSQLLREHVEKGDPVDVGNLAMMLHQREEQIASLLETLQGE